jgi:hypothetical protein
VPNQHHQCSNQILTFNDSYHFSNELQSPKLDFNKKRQREDSNKFPEAKRRRTSEEATQNKPKPSQPKTKKGKGKNHKGHPTTKDPKPPKTSTVECKFYMIGRCSKVRANVIALEFLLC